MISYVNVHAVLEGRRNRAKASSDDSESSQVMKIVIHSLSMYVIKDPSYKCHHLQFGKGVLTDKNKVILSLIRP